MKILRSLSEIDSSVPHAVTLGKFDGLHTAHAELITKTAARARQLGIPSLVCSFDISPRGILSWEEKAEMAGAFGADILLRCPFDEKMITTEAEDFLRHVLAGTMHAVYVCVGEDFRFGHGRHGDAAMIADSGLFGSDVIPQRQIGGQTISSTAVRTYLDGGQVEKANEMLGYRYFLSGSVVHGRHLGHSLGFPTLNVLPPEDKWLPAFGVYTSVTQIGEKAFPGITNIGIKPTVDGTFAGAETHLLGFDGDLYGAFVRTELLHYIRPEVKFPDTDTLKKQLTEDKEEGCAYFKLLT